MCCIVLIKTVSLRKTISVVALKIMGCPLGGEGGGLTETDMGRVVKNSPFIGDILNGFSHTVLSKAKEHKPLNSQGFSCRYQGFHFKLLNIPKIAHFAI